jgi:DNA-binding transcriptional MerR regulator
MTITEVAALVGLSPWTVRHRLIPQGLPHFRARANGKLLFYSSEVIRWIKRHQKGGINK